MYYTSYIYHLFECSIRAPRPIPNEHALAAQAGVALVPMRDELSETDWTWSL